MEYGPRTYSTKKMVENILCLIQRKKLKIGEVEVQAGKSPGYLSKLSKKAEETVPPIDMACDFARILGVSIDALLYGDYNYVPDNILFFESFLLEMRDRTCQREMIWEYINTHAIDSALCGKRSDILIVEKYRNDFAECDDLSEIKKEDGKLPPTVQTMRLMQQRQNPRHCMYGNYRVRSRYMPALPVYADRSGIRCRFDVDTRISIYSMRVDISSEEEREAFNGGQFFEVYFEHRVLRPDFNMETGEPPEENDYIWNLQSFYCTTANEYQVAIAIDMLYNEVIKSERDLSIDSSLKAAMQSFMSKSSNN